MATVTLGQRTRHQIMQHIRALLQRHIHAQDTRFPVTVKQIYDAAIPQEIQNAIQTVKSHDPEFLQRSMQLPFSCVYEDRINVEVRLMLKRHCTLPNNHQPLPLHVTTPIAAPLREWADARQDMLLRNHYIMGKLSFIVTRARTAGHIRFLWPELMAALPVAMRSKLGNTVARCEPAGMWEREGHDEEFYADYESCNDWIALATLLPDAVKFSDPKISHVNSFHHSKR